MKLRYIIILTVTALCLQQQLYAQSYVESALLFSRTKPGGSARIQGLGGSQIALGGDYSSAFSNPAGLGYFNKSEFSITPALNFANSKATYLGNVNEDSKSRFQVPGMSIVFNIPSGRDDGSFVGGSFAITLNRTNDFNRALTFAGENNNSSIIEYFKEQAFGNTTAQFDEGASQYNTPTGLAYFNFLIGPASLIDPANPQDEYFTDVQSDFTEITSPALQREENETNNSMNQWSFAYGANFDDRFYIGGAVGIATLKYNSKKLFTENFEDDPFYNGLSLEENLEIDGSGVNATIGAIARPVDFIQVGISYSTPTFYQLTETYDASLSTSWRNFNYYGDGSEMLNDESASTDIVTSDYNLTLPSKFSAGVAFISKIGFITGDVEITNPSRARYSSDTPGVSFGFDNEDIRSVYKSVVNYRVGAEYRYDIFRARAGFGVQGSTFKNDFEIDNKITTISGGLGVRLNNFYVDFALINSRGDTLYQPYTLSNGSPVVDIRNSTTTGLITLGFSY